MCIYDNCPYLCSSKKEHHSKYARIRRNVFPEKMETKLKSPKVNWTIVEELKVGNLLPISKSTIGKL